MVPWFVQTVALWDLFVQTVALWDLFVQTVALWDLRNLKLKLHSFESHKDEIFQVGASETYSRSFRVPPGPYKSLKVVKFHTFKYKA